MLTDNQILAIHKTLHTDASGVRINGQIYSVEQAPQTNCRFIRFGDIKFVEQNKNTTTLFAREAQAGATITWAIPNKTGLRWGLIKDYKILKPIPRIQ